MKLFLLILGVLIAADITYFACVNSGNSLIINFTPFIENFEIPSGIFYFLLGMYGFIGGTVLTCSKVLGMQKEIKKLKRKTEKSSIESEESTDRVKQLESRIKTLEAALKEALNKK